MELSHFPYSLVLGLGTAVVPDLVKVLERRGGWKLEYKLELFFIKFSATRSIAVWLDSKVRATQNRRMEANYLLGLLGPQAESAIPAMIRIYKNSDDPIGWRQNIIESLARINQRPDLVVPFLVESLSDPEASIAVSSELALVKLGTNSISAIPALRQALHHPRLLTALYAAQTIHRIDPKVSLAAVDEVMPLLVKALESHVRVNWGAAIQLLAQYGDRAKWAVPTLLRLLDDEDAFIRFSVTNSLPSIDPEAAAKAGVQ